MRAGIVEERRKRRRALLLVAAWALAGLSVRAEAGEVRSPYAGQERRAIKALSPEEVRGLLAGEGLGFAKAAELNRYPGPAHVLELSGKLHLTAEQTARTKALHRAMREEAVRLGREIVALEEELDALFAGGRIEERSLHALTGKIGRRRGALRAVHLKYHLKMKRLLTPHQVERYNRLRGYEAGESHVHGGHH